MPKTVSFSCDRKELLRGVQLASLVIDSRCIAPILANVLIRAERDTVVIRGTDLDNEISHTITRHGKGPRQNGSTTVQVKALMKFLTDADDIDMVSIEFELHSQTAKIGAGATFDMNALSPDDYPVFPESNLVGGFNISSPDLIETIRAVRPAISTEEVRYYLNGIFLEPKHKTMTATDGHRMHQAVMLISDTDAPDGIIPRKTIMVIEKWLKNSADVAVDMRKKDGVGDYLASEVAFTSGHTVLRAKLIDGTFPDYRRVIPGSFEGTAVLDTERLGKALKRVSARNGRNRQGIAMSITARDASVSRRDPDVGTISDTVPVQWDKAPITIGFNASLLQDVLAVFGDGEIGIELVDAGSPVRIRKTGAEHPFCILMPMRV